MPLDECGQFMRHAAARDRRVRDRTEALLRHVVDDVEDPEAAPVRELVVDEVRGPARIRLRLDQDWRTRTHGLAAGAALAHREPLFAIEPVDAVDARRLALAPEQDEQPPVSKASPLVGEIAKPDAKLRVRRATRAVSDHLPIRTDDAAGPTFRQAHHGPQVRDSVTLDGGPYH